MSPLRRSRPTPEKTLTIRPLTPRTARPRATSRLRAHAEVRRVSSGAAGSPGAISARPGRSRWPALATLTALTTLATLATLAMRPSNPPGFAQPGRGPSRATGAAAVQHHVRPGRGRPHPISSHGPRAERATGVVRPVPRKPTGPGPVIARAPRGRGPVGPCRSARSVGPWIGGSDPSGHRTVAVSGHSTPVSSSESVHSRRAAAGSLAAALRPTRAGAPRISAGPSGPT